MKPSVRTFLKYLCAVLLISMLSVPLYGNFYPWEPAQKTLEKYRDEIVLLVGFRSIENPKRNYKTQTKTYLIIETENFSSVRLKITADTKGRYEVEKYNGGFLNYVCTFIVLALFTIWLWIGQRSHNKRMQTDRPTAGH